MFSSCYQPQEGEWLVERQIPLPEHRWSADLTPGLFEVCASAVDSERCSRNSASLHLASNQEKRSA